MFTHYSQNKIYSPEKSSFNLLFQLLLFLHIHRPQIEAHQKNNLWICCSLSTLFLEYIKNIILMHFDLALNHYVNANTESRSLQKKYTYVSKQSQFFLKKSLLNFGVTLINKLCRFQVYNSRIHHLYIVLCVYHPKSSIIPSPFSPFSIYFHSFLPLVIAILLSVSMRVFFFSFA